MEINKQVPFKNALITNVKMKDGSFSQIVTLFNNEEISFEEVNIGVNRTLEHISDAYSMQSDMCHNKNGKAELFAKYPEKIIEGHFNPLKIA